MGTAPLGWLGMSTGKAHSEVPAAALNGPPATLMNLGDVGGRIAGHAADDHGVARLDKLAQRNTGALGGSLSMATGNASS